MALFYTRCLEKFKWFTDSLSWESKQYTSEINIFVCHGMFYVFKEPTSLVERQPSLFESPRDYKNYF